MPLPGRPGRLQASGVIAISIIPWVEGAFLIILVDRNIQDPITQSAFTFSTPLFVNKENVSTQKCGQYQKILWIVRYKVLQRMSESNSSRRETGGSGQVLSFRVQHLAASVVSCDRDGDWGLIGAKRGETRTATLKTKEFTTQV